MMFGHLPRMPVELFELDAQRRQGLEIVRRQIA
jgi:hypothetical protein